MHTEQNPAAAPVVGDLGGGEAMGSARRREKHRRLNAQNGDEGAHAGTPPPARYNKCFTLAQQQHKKGRGEGKRGLRVAGI